MAKKVEWNGKERRKVMFDKEFYDKMMEVHSDIKYMKVWTEDHDIKDDKRFKDTNDKVEWVTKIAWMGIGGLAVIQLVLHFSK